MQKKNYELNSIDFLNATLDEIYYRKKHYVKGKDLLEFKSMLAGYFAQVERIFRCVYYSNISLDIKEIDLDLFKRQFPFIYDTYYGNTYAKTTGEEESSEIDGVEYYTWILEQLRNINLHAVISTPISKIFRISSKFMDVLPKFSEKVLYIKDGVLTVAGMMGLLLPVLRPDKGAHLLGYIFHQWSNVLWEEAFEESFSQKDVLWEKLQGIYKTDYEVAIRSKEQGADLLSSIFGREKNRLQLSLVGDTIRFVWDCSQTMKMTNLQVSGCCKEYANETLLSIDMGSNVGVYFSENYTLHIRNVKKFEEFCKTVPSFMAVAYLYHNQITVFDETTIENLGAFYVEKLNYPKFYVDKNIPILCYGSKNADIREINKAISANLLKLFLDFEEAVVFRKEIMVFGAYSKFASIMKKFNVPSVLMNKMVICRNFCSHGWLLDEYYCSNPGQFFKITLSFIIETICELIEFLQNAGETEAARWLQWDLEEYVLNSLIGIKYKRIFERSIKLFHSKGDWVAKNCEAIKKSLKAVENSCIPSHVESMLIHKMKRKFSFNLSPKLVELPDNCFKFNHLILCRLYGGELEIRGEKTGVDILEFFKTPETKWRLFTKHGKNVQLQLIEEKREGVLCIQSYKIQES